MKRIMLLALLLSLLVVVCGCAKREMDTQSEPTNAPSSAPLTTGADVVQPVRDNIRAQMGAPETLSFEFSSKNGGQHYRVNAEVVVPDVTSVSGYEVEPCVIPAENVLAFANVVFGEGGYTGDTEYRAPEPTDDLLADHPVYAGVTELMMELESVERRPDRPEWPIGGLSAFANDQNGIPRGDIDLNFYSLKNYFEHGFVWDYAQYMDYSETVADAKNMRTTRAEAFEIASRAAKALAPELTTCASGLISNVEGDAQAYQFCFTHAVDGIPVTYTPIDATKIDEDENEQPVHYRIGQPYELLRIVVADSGITSARMDSPYKVLGALEEDVKLLPFDQIFDVFKSITPLKYAHLESSGYELDFDIYRVEFGYTRVDFKDKMYRYKLVPVWDFFGVYIQTKDGKTGAAMYEDRFSHLTINAVDGTIIDRRYGY